MNKNFSQNRLLKQTRRTGKVLNFLVLFCLMFSMATGTPVVQAQAPEPTGAQTNTDTPTADPTISPTETPTPIVATATPSPVSTVTETPMPSATLAPSTGDQATIPTLSLSTNPEFVVPGESLMLKWVIEVAALQERQLVLQITLPDGITPKEKEAVYDPASHLLMISITDPSGQIDLEVSDISGDVTITAVLLEDKETLAEAKLFIPIHEQFILDETGGAIETKDGKIKVEFPVDALTEKTVIEIGAPAGDAIPAYSLLGKPFEIKAHREQNKEDLKHFSKELSIIVSYADLGIPPEREGDLHVYWYNGETGEWEALPTWVDQETKTLQAITDHFTVFDLNVSNWQSNHLPTVDAFQVSGYTGAGTYSLPIQVPPGPGGFQPSLALTYNSQVVDQSTLNAQASWVGMGWSLDSSYIELDTHGTGSWGGDDTHLLQVGGISTRIVLDGAGSYRATDENFWKITNTNNTWVVQDKQGTTYYFEYVSSYPYETGRCPSPSAGYQYKGYRWSLSRVRNIFNQEIQYTYATQTKGMYVHQYYNNGGNPYCLTGLTIDPITATYPEYIIYADGKYRVKFDKGLSPNRSDYQAAWDGPGEFNAYEKYRLQNIYVEQDADGNGEFETILRRYKFAYKADTDSDIIFPGYTWSAGGKTTTLKSVQEFGVGGNGTPLPATTFTYGDSLHLTRVDNGYGGAVEFTYGRWYDSTDARKSYTVEQRFGQAGYPCYIDDWQPWFASTGEMNCGDGDGDPLKVWGFPSGMGTAYNFTNADYSAYGINHSKDLVRPGGVYKLTTDIAWKDGMSVRIGVFDGIRYQWFNVTTSNSTNIIPLAVDAYTAQVVIEETGGTGIGNNHPAPASVFYLKLQLLPSIYRVTQKKIYESPTDVDPYVYSYDYTKDGADSAAFNNGVTAPASTCDPSTPSDPNNPSGSCFEFFQRYSEFRGHGQVTETRPDGTKTITQFYQDDLLKGRPSSITMTDGAITANRAIYSYTSTILSIGTYKPCNACPAFPGLGRNWIYTNVVENRVYAIDGNYSPTQTLYTYESDHGNLATQTEKQRSGNSWLTYRTTQFDYFPNDTNYLVGLPARQQVKDANNVVIAETLNLYDANTSYTQVPAIGKLTAVRTWMDGALATGRYSQTSFGYDTWGNQTSVTTYNDYGTASVAPPSTGAATATTVYDPMFHVYPISQTTPPPTAGAQSLTTTWGYDFDNNELNDYILGVPTRETNPNGAMTEAVYDSFGRILNLYRPDPVTGDAETIATLTITYQSTFPFTTTLTQKINDNQSYTVQRVYDGIGRQTQIVSGPSSDPNQQTIVDTHYIDATTTQQSLPYFDGETPAYTTTTTNPAAHTVTVLAPDGTYTTTIADGLTSTVSQYNADGSLFDNHTTTTLNDVWGRVVSVTPPTGPAVAYTYDELSRLVTATRGANIQNSANPGVNGLVAWWGMNEAGGTRNDSFSTNHLTDTNTVDPIAKQGNAADFEKDNLEYLSVPSSSQLQMSTSDVYVGAWIKAEDTMVSNPNVISKLGTDSGKEFNLRVLPSGVVQFLVYDTTGNNYTIASTTATITYGQWVYVEGWTDKANRTVYVNVNNGAAPGSATWTSTENRNGAGTSALMIGARNLNGSIAEYWDGMIDEAVYYKRKLTSAERAWLYNNNSGRAYANISDPASPGTTGLVAWWSMNEAGGTRNDSFSTNHLTDTNTVEPAARQGNGTDFEKNNLEYLSKTSSAQLQMSSSDIYVGAWIKAEDTMVSNPNVISKLGVNREFNLRVQPSGVVQFLVYDTTGNNYTIASSNTSITYGKWYYVEGWTDKANRTVYVNVDNGNPGSATWLATENRNGAGTSALMIGARMDSAGGIAEYWDGMLDEAVYYKRQLTAAERAWLFKNGRGRAYTELAAPVVTGITTITLIYDHAGRKLSMSDPDMGNWTYGYDALGNLTHQTDARGQRICLYYDALNRLIGKHYPADNNCLANPTYDVSYGYDAIGVNGIGRRTSMTSGTITNAWTYDTRGRMKTETVMGYTTEWEYNSADMPIWMKYPVDNEQVRYEYNDRMLLESVIGTSAYVSAIGYDSAGRMTTRAMGNGLTQTFDYYDWNERVNNVGQGGRLQSLLTGTLQDLNYTYDAAGNITGITNSSNPLAVETNVFEYDELDRLDKWILDNGTPEDYTYNTATGNLETKAGATLIYNAQLTACGVSNRIIPHAVSDMGSNDYFYDCNGNQTTRVIGTDTFNLIYDAENRLVEVKKNTVSMATFVYDGDGRRVKSVMGSETILFIGAHFEIKNPGSGQEVTKYYFAGGQRVAVRKYSIPQSTTLTYLLGDHLRSTSLSVDADTGETIETRYKPWGEVHYTTPSKTLPTRYTFTGQYSYIADEATDLGSAGFGLMFYNARMYDPYLNHFTQPDSIVPDPYNSQDWDRYSYARNNPIRYTDPSGHAAISDSDGGGSLEQTLLYFKKYGKHGDTFNDYYATVYFAEQALAESLSGGITLDELKILSAYDESIKNEYNKAINWAHQGSLTEGMFSNFREPLALRASKLGFDYMPELSQSNEENGNGIGITVAGAAAVVMWRGQSFEFTAHALQQIDARGLNVNQVQSVINNSKSFSYWHEGVLKQGWYSSGQKIFVASANGEITTVMTNVGPQYIGDLRNNEP